MAETKKYIRKRMLVILFILTTFIVWILVRLFWIQVVSTRSYSSHKVDLVRNSVFQRQKGLVLNNGRGQFYDRNMSPLTGVLKSSLVAFPIHQEDSKITALAVQRLSVILDTPQAELNKWFQNVEHPTLWKDIKNTEIVQLSKHQIEEIQELHFPYVQVAEINKRYEPSSAASHLLGFVGQNPERISSQFKGQLEQGRLTLHSEIGGSGLEKTMQRWLQGDGSTSLSFFVNPKGQYVQGLGVRTVGGDNRHYPLKLITTIDYSLQSIVDRLIKQSGIKEGAVVVLDSKSSDILAMASIPAFDPNHVQPDERDWNNRALQMTVPGSIYKTVVAAAALEEGVVTMNEQFECNGSLGKYHFHCWKKGGHGKITFAEGYADSCNLVFAKVAQRLSDVQLEKYASKLGLLAPVGWTGKVNGDPNLFQQLDSEDAGQIFAKGTASKDEGVRIQTAIGQRDVRITPLQAANLVVTLLNSGKVSEPRAVLEIRSQDNLRFQEFKEKDLISKGKGVSSKTSNRLLGLMREVVTNGTGKPLMSAKWKLGGKTGTAETVIGGKQRVNQWFIGYGPTNSPRYAFAVVAENVSPQYENLVLPFVRKMMDAFADKPIQ